ncbi:uncharacterized protein LOC143445974 isoform X1 [Clavelina lepadiformis]|uniref:uncharacterized protein LOC143445974 isoform X1 n=2 Tax=Clavelina lepadiformis TaxID=159417 RepID=UPI0040435BE2
MTEQKAGGQLFERFPGEPMKSTHCSAIYKCKRIDGIFIAEKCMLKRHFLNAKMCLCEIENFKEFYKKSSYPENVVLYLGTEEKGEFMSIYMELCDGDIEEWIHGELPGCNLTPLEICKQTTDGINNLHTKCSMIHRDVKPSNFLMRIGDDGKTTVKVCDFGLTKKLRSGETHATTKSGSTESYMAPENHTRKKEEKKKWKKSADIFSLGVLFNYVLTKGSHPFGEDPYEQVLNLRKREIPKLNCADFSDLLSNEQKELAYDLIENMLAFDPEKRPIIEEVKDHPIFWDSEKKIKFYEKANEHFHRLKKHDVESYKQSLKDFEEHKITINNVPDSLRKEEDYPVKKCGNIHELLIVIRNMNQHAEQKESAASRLLLGVSEDGSRNYNDFFESLTGQYPRLLAHLNNFIRGEPFCRKSTSNIVESSIENVSHHHANEDVTTAPDTEFTRKDRADGADEVSSNVAKTSSEQSFSSNATSIQDEVIVGPSTLTTQEFPGLEITIEKLSSINDLISKQKINEALKVCEDLKSAMKTTSLTADDAINVGNDIIAYMSNLSCETYSPIILPLLLLAGDLHKQIDDPTEKVKLMKRCAYECYRFILRYNKNLQRTTYRHVISRMTGFVHSIQSVKVDDKKLVATSKAECWTTIGLCRRYLAEYSRAIEVLQPAITTLESTFGDGCRKMGLYSACCNNMGTDYYFNNQPEDAEAFYIKSFHVSQEVEDESEQWKMENIHCTINGLCNLYQDHPTMTRDKGSDVYNYLQKQKRLTGLPRFWNMLLCLRLMILLNLGGDVKSICCNELATMAANISPLADQRNDLCIGLKRTAEHLSAKNEDESRMSLLVCVDKFEKW